MEHLSSLNFEFLCLIMLSKYSLIGIIFVPWELLFKHLNSIIPLFSFTDKISMDEEHCVQLYEIIFAVYYWRGTGGG